MLQRYEIESNFNNDLVLNSQSFLKKNQSFNNLNHSPLSVQLFLHESPTISRIQALVIIFNPNTMKFTITLLLALLFTSNSFCQNHNLSIYGAFGYQDYRGDRGNGLWDHRRCVWGAGHLGIDYGLSNSFDLKLHFSGGAMGYLQ